MTKGRKSHTIDNKDNLMHGKTPRSMYDSVDQCSEQDNGDSSKSMKD
jgi:hypothetical protein